MPTINFTIQPVQDASEVVPVGVIVGTEIRVDLEDQFYNPVTSQTGTGPTFIFPNIPEGKYIIKAYTLDENGQGFPQPWPAPFITMEVRSELRRPCADKAVVSVVPDVPAIP